jgi:fructoselysine-6-P-deglycase FrlB-like protein
MSITWGEIASQPAAWRRAAALASEVSDLLPAPGLSVCVVGCGTSLYMAQAWAALRETAGHGRTDAFAASELPRRSGYDALVAISRSGTTSEVVHALRQDIATRSLTITAVPGSPAAEAADAAITLDFADERSVVQTRFATSALTLLRAHAGGDVERAAQDAEHALEAPLPVQLHIEGIGPDPAAGTEGTGPNPAAGTDGTGPNPAATAGRASASTPEDSARPPGDRRSEAVSAGGDDARPAGAPRQWTFLGRGWAVGLAHEAALKLREAAQQWAEAYPALEYRHGPIAIAGKGTVVWSLDPLDSALAGDVRATGATIVCEPLDPLAALVLAQRTAVALAQSKGLDPDRPRNLARSVVLEGAALEVLS